MASHKLILPGLMIMALIIIVSPASATWACANCLNKTTITVIGGSMAASDYQLFFRIYNISGTSSGMNFYSNNFTYKNMSDLKIYDSDDATQLYYWVNQTYTNGEDLWLKVHSSIPKTPSTSSLYFYYNDTTTAPFNFTQGENVFANSFYTHFNAYNGSLYQFTPTAPTYDYNVQSVLYMAVGYNLAGRGIRSLSTFTNGTALTGTSSDVPGYRYVFKAYITQNNGQVYSGWDQTNVTTLNMTLLTAYNYASAKTRLSTEYGTSSTDKSTGMPGGDTNYHIFEVRWTNSTTDTSGYAEAYEDYTNSIASTTTIPNTTSIQLPIINTPICVVSGGTTQEYIDYMYMVRYMPNPQPTASTYTFTLSAVTPVASFSCTPLATIRNATITCTDTSTNVPTTWSWYSASTTKPLFSGNDTHQNPVFFSHKIGGWYNLCLIASNAAGSNTYCSAANYIWVMKPWI